MVINFKMGELKGIIENLVKLMEIGMPIPTGIKFKRLAKFLFLEIEIMEETRKGLIEKYGKRDENNTLVIKNEKYDFDNPVAFNQAYMEMNNADVSIEFEPVPLTALGKIDPPPICLLVLDKFIDEAK